MPLARRDSVGLYHEVSGSGSPPMAFVPGWCCDHEFFEPQVRHFGQSHQTLVFDPRGCGRSDKPDGPYDIPTLAEDLSFLSSEAGLRRPILVGHSLGAMVAIELAAHRPGFVAAVVAIEPGPIDMIDDARRYYEAIVDQLKGPSGEEVRREFIASDFLPADDPTTRKWVIENMTSVPLPVAATMLAGTLEWDGVAALAGCTCPLLVIRSTPTGGSNDPDRLRARKPDVVIGVTVGAGHFNQLLVPEQVNAMIDRFVTAYVPGPAG